MDANIRSIIRAVFTGMDGDARLDGSEMAAHMPTLHMLAGLWGGDGEVVELGVGRGWSTIALLSGLLPSGRTLRSYDVAAERKQAAIFNWGIPHDHPAIRNWDFRLKRSMDAACDFQDGSVSLLFLDTTHTYEETRAELSTWLPKIHRNGLICGHDYYLYKRPDWAHVSGVHRAVDEFAMRHTARFRLQVLPHDEGLFILWPRTAMG